MTPKRGENYKRNGDMTPPGDSVLVANIQHDGDVCLRIDNRDAYGDFKSADIEFCVSGGKSINTVHALHALVAAMMRDASPEPEPDRYIMGGMPDSDYRDAQVQLRAESLHLRDVYAALGIKWGEDPFAVIKKLRSAT